MKSSGRSRATLRVASKTCNAAACREQLAHVEAFHTLSPWPRQGFPRNDAEQLVAGKIAFQELIERWSSPPVRRPCAIGPDSMRRRLSPRREGDLGSQSLTTCSCKGARTPVTSVCQRFSLATSEEIVDDRLQGGMGERVGEARRKRSVRLAAGLRVEAGRRDPAPRLGRAEGFDGATDARRARLELQGGQPDIDELAEELQGRTVGVIGPRLPR